MAKLITEFNEVPETIKNAAELVCRRFCITGECDAMYICNVIANETGTGNGCSYFDETPIITRDGWEKAANSIQHAYGSLITVKEKEELVSIMENKQIDTEIAIKRLQTAHAKYSDELLNCEKANSYRIPYLETLLKNINSLIVDLTVEENKRKIAERKAAFREDFQKQLENIGADELLKNSPWEWSSKDTCFCSGISPTVFDKYLKPLGIKHGFIENKDTEVWLFIEYQKDKQKIVYIFDFDTYGINMNDALSCETLDQAIIKIAEEEGV